MVLHPCHVLTHHLPTLGHIWAFLSIYPSFLPCTPIHPPIYLSIYLPVYLSIHPPVHLSTHLPNHLSTYQPVYPSICPAFHPPLHGTVRLSIRAAQSFTLQFAISCCHLVRRFLREI